MPLTKGQRNWAVRSHKTTWNTGLMSWRFRFHPSMLRNPRSIATCFWMFLLSLTVVNEFVFPRCALPSARRLSTSALAWSELSNLWGGYVQSYTELYTLTRFHSACLLSTRRYPPVSKDLLRQKSNLALICYMDFSDWEFIAANLMQDLGLS